MKDIEENNQEWVQYVSSNDFAKAPLPRNFSNLSDIGHLMIIRILKPD